MGDNRFVIDGDGTITRTISDLDSIILNILRVGANKTNVLAAYKARKKCYKICKKLLGRDDYKEYVEGLQLDHYPNEFVKAELGRQYHNWLRWFIFPPMGILLSPLIIYKCCKLSKKIKSFK